MSQSEIQRFAADLRVNAGLRADAEKTEADKPHVPPLAHLTSFAVSKGYSFTLDHAREYVKVKAKAAGKELTDAELNGVAGGGALPSVNTLVNASLQQPGSPQVSAATFHTAVNNEISSVLKMITGS